VAMEQRGGGKGGSDDKWTNDKQTNNDEWRMKERMSVRTNNERWTSDEQVMN
jgi:hypothetical protein